jgi:hypothetical protein
VANKRTTCRWCDRDLPAERHHLVRYCPDRDCAALAKADAKSKRRRARGGKPVEPGTQRKIFGHMCVYLPDHPIAPPSGWARVSRVAVYERLDGVDPACSSCGTRLDWSARHDEAAFPIIKPDLGDDVVMCRACCAGARELAAVGVPSPTSLLLAQAEDVCGPQGHAVSRGPQTGPLVGAQVDGDDFALARLVDVERRLESVWDGTEGQARLFVAAAHLLALRARRASSR